MISLATAPWVVVTPTAVKQYRECPRAYVLRHHVAFPRRARESDGLALGATVHEELAARHADGLARHDEPGRVADGTVPDGRVMDAVAAHATCCPGLHEGATHEGSEVPVSWFWRRQPRVLLTGRFDALWRHADGTLEVREYKSGAWSRSLDESTTVTIYALLALVRAAAAGRRPERVTVGIEHLRSPPGTEVVERHILTRDEVRARAEEVADFVHAVRTDDTWAARPSPGRCGTCDYAWVCPASTVPAEV